MSIVNLKYTSGPFKSYQMKIFLFAVLIVLDLACLAIFFYLWKSSKYPGAEIGNMDWGLAKIFGIGFVIISLVIGGIIYFKK